MSIWWALGKRDGRKMRCADALKRQGMNRLPVDASSRDADLRHGVARARVERNNFRPGPPPTLADRRVFLTPEACFESRQCRFPAYGVSGAVNGLQGRRNGLGAMRESG